MVIDYKGVSFSFDKLKKQKRLRRIRLIAVGVVLGLLFLVLLNALDSGKINTIQRLLLEGKISDAAARLAKTDTSLFHGNRAAGLQVELYFISVKGIVSRHP